MIRFLIRPLVATALVLALWTPMRHGGPLWARAEAAALADAGGNWILLGLVADAGGGPSQWRDEPGFVFPGGSAKPDRVVKVGDRVGRPFEREVTNFDTTGEYKVGTVLQVLEIGGCRRRPTGGNAGCV